MGWSVKESLSVIVYVSRFEWAARPVEWGYTSEVRTTPDIGRLLVFY